MKQFQYVQITVQPWARDCGRHQTKELKITVVGGGEEVSSTQVIDEDMFHSMFDYAVERALLELRHKLGLTKRG